MLKRINILPRFTLRGVFRYAQKAAISNLALGLIVLPTGTNSVVSPQNSLIIPEQTLAQSFNIKANQDEPKTQIPLVYTYVSQKFSNFHPGIDLATKYGTKIYPIEIGVVEEAGYSQFGFGNMIMVDHENGYESLYAHLSKIEVKKGDHVYLDTEIGLVGTTGHSTGPHLHLEVHENGKPINPLLFLPFGDQKPLLLTALTSIQQ